MNRSKIIMIMGIMAVINAAALHAQLNNVTYGYIGNTFNGGNNKWVMNYAEELDVASDGTMITASEWDEAGRCIGIFKDGQPVALVKQSDPNDGDWGWGTATKAVAIDNNYLYAVNQSNNLNRFNRSNGYAYVDKTSMSTDTIAVVGMTCAGGFLYLINQNGVVQKRGVTALNTVTTSFTVAGGYDVAVDAGGNIWVLTINKEVLKFNAAGAGTGTKIAAQNGWEPSAVNYDAFNDQLLVPDNGSRRQVIKFNTSGVQIGTFGDLNGISGGVKGVVGDLRFWNIAGCGTDAAGNMYVALNEDCVSLRKFNAGGVKQWEVLGTMFCDIASIDPASDGKDMYTVNEHIRYDYTSRQWSLVSMTCDRIANPSDPRGAGTGTDITSALMRRVNGKLLMFTTGMYADGFDVYRFDGEIAVLCQSYFGLGWSALPDKNGNIWYVSGSSIKKKPLTGFSGENPQFGADVTVTTSIPSPITEINRLEYDASADVMYIAGWSSANPNATNDWGLIGSTLARYPNWSTGNRTASHAAVMPDDVEGYSPKAMSMAGEYVFVCGSRDRGKTVVFNASNLTSVGFIAPPTDMGEPGWIDMPYAVQAFKKTNGQYLILVEENYRGKNMLYQWTPGTVGAGAMKALATPATVSSGLKKQVLFRAGRSHMGTQMLLNGKGAGVRGGMNRGAQLMVSRVARVQ